jgi:hypothetical protein
LRHNEGRCSRMRPEMKWRTENSIGLSPDAFLVGFSL